MNKRVSAIVTCYNHGVYIEQCLRSIFTQTYKNIDLLVINDGSSDNSDEIISRVLKSSPFEVTEYVKQENLGIGVTRNSGIEWAERKGNEYLLFIDSDNYLNATHIEQIVNVAESQSGDIIYGNLKNPETNEYVIISQVYTLDSLLVGNYIDNCSLFRLSIIRQARYDLTLNRKNLEDYDFILNLIINNDAKPIYCSGVDLNYRVLENSVSRHGDKKFYYETYIYILDKYWLVLHSKVRNAILENLHINSGQIQALKDHSDFLTEKVQLINSRVEIFKKNNYILEKNNYILEKNNKILKETMITLHEQRAGLEQEKVELLNSKSYKIGHFFVLIANKLRFKNKSR